jgi:hypothetical protein
VATPETPLRPLLDLSRGWQAHATADELRPPPPGTSWTDDAAMRHFSGAVRYTRRFVLSSRSTRTVMLDFGEGMPLTESDPDRPRAAIAAPVREAALVRVNGRAAGTVWAAPWRIDIAPLLRDGTNEIEVVVMNGAGNALSAQTPPDRRLLTMRYHERFVDQDRGKLAPAPSGLLGRITLLAR